MVVQREEMYFEPRVISSVGSIRWYGDVYISTLMGMHAEQTVYIRDTGDELLIYELIRDDITEDTSKIKATFQLICKLEKEDKDHIYGRKKR